MIRAFQSSMPGFALFAAIVIAALAVFFGCGLRAHADGPATLVQLDAQKAAPRAVEPFTERAIVRDYCSAWTSMAHALEFNVVDPLEGPFTGPARQMLQARVTSQQKSGLRQRYLNQNHKLEAVFYAPEGDVIQLHDTAEYQQQILDGNKSIRDERVVLHYVVLMTPSADRWVIRQLQAVPSF